MADPLKLSLEMPVVEAVRLMLLHQLGNIQQQARLVLEADRAVSVAAVHDLRVALRKNITVFTAFAPWLDPDWLKKAQKGYGRLLKLLGRVRDLDVLRAGLGEEPGELAPLIALVDRDCGRLRQKLPERLQGKVYAKWMGRQVAALSLPESVLRMNPVPVTAQGEVRLFRLQDCMPVILYQAGTNLTVYRNLFPDPNRLPAQILENPELVREFTRIPDDVMHQLRITAKSFRYTLEAFQSLLGQPAKKLISDFKVFQDLLGEWHDASVALAYLEKLPDDFEKAARSELQAGRLKKQEELRISFEQRWLAMSPAWFHERLAKCLEHALPVKNRPESPAQPEV